MGFFHLLGGGKDTLKLYPHSRPKVMSKSLI